LTCDEDCTAKARVYQDINFKQCLDECAVTFVRCADLCQKRWACVEFITSTVW